MSCPTTLWRYNVISGLWVSVRTCSTENAETWLELFKEDEPDGDFLLSNIRPKFPPARFPNVHSKG